MLFVSVRPRAFTRAWLVVKPRSPRPPKVVMSSEGSTKTLYPLGLRAQLSTGVPSWNLSKQTRQPRQHQQHLQQNQQLLTRREPPQNAEKRRSIRTPRTLLAVPAPMTSSIHVAGLTWSAMGGVFLIDCSHFTPACQQPPITRTKQGPRERVKTEKGHISRRRLGAQDKRTASVGM